MLHECTQTILGIYIEEGKLINLKLSIPKIYHSNDWQHIYCDDFFNVVGEMSKLVIKRRKFYLLPKKISLVLSLEKKNIYIYQHK